MWDWIASNKEWFFSGIGLVSITFVIWMGKKLIQWIAGTRPHVEISGAFVALPTGGLVHGLSIKFLNPTDREIVVENFVIETTDRRTLFLANDSFTGASQGRKVVKPGDSYSFHISAAALRDTGYPLADLRCAVVQSPVSRGYRSSRRQLQRFLRTILAEAPVA